MGEEVKAKNEKRRTRTYTRARWGDLVKEVVFFEISLGGFFKRVTSNNRFDRVLIRRCVD